MDAFYTTPSMLMVEQIAVEFSGETFFTESVYIWRPRYGIQFKCRPRCKTETDFS